MPWTETCVMKERVKFIMEVLDSTYSMAELCNYYGISRKTGYKWLDRYRQGGIEALHNRSRKPYSHPHEMSRQVKVSILAIKKRFPKWGAPKIRSRLERIHPAWGSYPAISTIGLFLHKQGLTHPRKRRRRATPNTPAERTSSSQPPEDRTQSPPIWSKRALLLSMLESTVLKMQRKNVAIGSPVTSISRPLRKRQA